MSAQTNSNSTAADAKQREAQNRQDTANNLNEAAEYYYEQYWDAKNIADVEQDAGKFDHRADDKDTLQILEYSDVDTIVDTFEQQIFIQEKSVAHTTNGDCLLIRQDNGSKNVASEKDRLLNTQDQIGFCPGVISFGRADTETSFKWFWLINAAEFAEAWADDDHPCEPTDIYRNRSDGTVSAMFAPDVVARSGAVMQAWGETPDRIREQVNNGDDRALMALLSAGGDA